MPIEIKGPIVSDEDKWIYDWFDVPCTAPQSVKKAIAETKGDLHLLINSPGGDMFAASEIYEALQSFEGAVHIKVVFAASAASFIACVGESEIVPTGMIMIHNVSSYAHGDYNDMQHNADVLLKASKAVAKAYEIKTGMSQDELIALMDKETWMTAEEAVEKGFIDKISENKNANKAYARVQLAASLSGLLPTQTIEKMKNERARLNAQLELLKLKGGNQNE